MNQTVRDLGFDRDSAAWTAMWAPQFAREDPQEMARVRSLLYQFDIGMDMIKILRSKVNLVKQALETQLADGTPLGDALRTYASEVGGVMDELHVVLAGH